MIHELRRYQTLPGNLPGLLELLEAKLLPIACRYGTLRGCWTPVSGTMNTVMFLWEYESIEERIAKRAALARDPDWLAIAEEAAGYLIEQQGEFIAPVPFLAEAPCASL
ncbi:NIPSNAP family protein (plasmid) [Paraburkholderia sp. FT54]|uniref:NIPSNAP family protein n=1 Tax=Paraburkholderia sp. FT54 TaxID=3074437 RepID=UPI00287762CB|nr:NIPSNAP family protein [Paraburkholderia sp. FT54]WNC95513.1 NIPSNAP family protein [Paraburkholderia sp. FT54]